MNALVNFAPEKGSVELREKEVPEIGEEDVLLKVEAVGVCGSDLHQWHGSHSWHVNYPCTLGHEFAGVVAGRGSRVKELKEGDRVVSETAAVIDIYSPMSRQGLYNLDPSRLGFGYGVDGAMTEFVKVPERCLHAVPDELPFHFAALTEPCCVAFNAVCEQSRVRPGDHVLIIGPGPIGLLCAMMAKLSGAGKVIVAGLPADKERLEVAKTIGADYAVDSGIEELVRSLGDGMGVDLVIDAAGVSQTLKTSIDVVRPAGQVTKVGWGPQAMNFSLDAAVQKAITIKGSFSHNWPMWERVLRLMSTGQLDLSSIVGWQGGLEDWRTGFETMQSGEVVKSVIVSG